MSLPQYLIDKGYEEAPANVNDRDASRRVKGVNGYHVYLSDSEETARDAEEKEWEDGASTRAWKDLRTERDRKIAATDWRAMPDLTLSDAWKTYRQELRDMTKTLSDDDVANLEEIEWPTEPS